MSHWVCGPVLGSWLRVAGAEGHDFLAGFGVQGEEFEVELFGQDFAFRWQAAAEVVGQA